MGDTDLANVGQCFPCLIVILIPVIWLVTAQHPALSLVTGVSSATRCRADHSLYLTLSYYSQLLIPCHPAGKGSAVSSVFCDLIHCIFYSTDLLPTFPQTLKQILFLCLHCFVLIQNFGRRHLNINVFSLWKRSSKSYRIRLILVGVKLRVRVNYRCTPG